MSAKQASTQPICPLTVVFMLFLICSSWNQVVVEQLRPSFYQQRRLNGKWEQPRAHTNIDTHARTQGLNYFEPCTWSCISYILYGLLCLCLFFHCSVFLLSMFSVLALLRKSKPKLKEIDHSTRIGNIKSRRSRSFKIIRKSIPQTQKIINSQNQTHAKFKLYWYLFFSYESLLYFVLLGLTQELSVGKSQIRVACSVGSTVWLGTELGTLHVYCAMTYKQLCQGSIQSNRFENTAWSCYYVYRSPFLR